MSNLCTTLNLFYPKQTKDCLQTTSIEEFEILLSLKAIIIIIFLVLNDEFWKSYFVLFNNRKQFLAKSRVISICLYSSFKEKVEILCVCFNYFIKYRCLSSTNFNEKRPKRNFFKNIRRL